MARNTTLTLSSQLTAINKNPAWAGSSTTSVATGLATSAASTSTISLATAGTGYSDQAGQTTTAATGSGSGMTVNVVTNGSGVVTSVEIVSPGSGYNNGDTVTIDNGNGDATLTVTSAGGNLPVSGSGGFVWTYTNTWLSFTVKNTSTNVATSFPIYDVNVWMDSVITTNDTYEVYLHQQEWNIGDGLVQDPTFAKVRTTEVASGTLSVADLTQDYTFGGGSGVVFTTSQSPISDPNLIAFTYLAVNGNNQNTNTLYAHIDDLGIINVMNANMGLRADQGFWDLGAPRPSTLV